METQVSKVGDDFELIAFDFVSNPSTHGAFLYPMNESVDNTQTGRTCGQYCKAEDIINHIIRGEVMKDLKNIIRNIKQDTELVISMN